MKTALRGRRSVRLVLLAVVTAFVFALFLPGVAGAGAPVDNEEDPYATTTTTTSSTETSEVGGTEVTDPGDPTDPGQEQQQVQVGGAEAESDGGTLPFTGGDIAVLSAIGAALVALGIVLVVVRRRRAAHV